MKKKIYRYLKTIFIVIVVGLISNWLVQKTLVSAFSIFEAANLFTYFGVLIGFSLTIYTFGLSMVSDIKKKIEELEKLTIEQKEELYNKLVSGFNEIKEDIWLIFYSIIIVICFAVAKEIPNPFGWQVAQFKLPQTINLTLFITTTIAMADIMRTLFNLSEINLELNKNKKSSTNENNKTLKHE
jgi:hypothetical protein